MLVLRYLFKFIQLLHSENSPNQLCWGFVVGMFMGFTPTLTLHWFGYVVLLFILCINMGAAFLGFALFGILAFVLDPLFSSIGLFVLTEVEALVGLWTWAYHMPILPYTRFNNSIVMGSFIVAFLMAAPLFYFSRIGILRYRDTVVTRIKQSHFARSVMATKLYRLYVKYRELKQ